MVQTAQKAAQTGEGTHRSKDGHTDRRHFEQADEYQADIVYVTESFNDRFQCTVSSGLSEPSQTRDKKDGGRQKRLRSTDRQQ